MIVVISCGARKAATRQPAAMLYTGSHFKTAYRWARSVVPSRAIFILSAKYGLIESSKVIEPYDLRLGQLGSITPDAVREQAVDLSIANEHTVIVVGGQDYVALAREVWPDCLAPFGKEAGIKGIGYSLQAMNRQMGRVPC